MKQLLQVKVFLFGLIIFPVLVSAQDVGVTKILSPVSACGSSADVVKVIVKNFGTSSQSNILVSLSSSGSFTFSGTDTLKKTLSGGSQDTLTFKSTLNTTSGGTYKLKVYTTLSSDVDKTNDTSSISITAGVTPTTPTGTGGSRCGSGLVKLKAPSTTTGSKTYWYTSTTGSKSISSGDSVFFNVVSTQTYYAKSYMFKKDTFTTTFAAGNGQQGIMFDVRAVNDIVLDSFNLNISSTTKDTVYLYYKTGTHVGYELTKSAWTLFGKAYVTGKSTGNPSRMPVGGLALTAGKLYALYFTRKSNTDIAYTNASASTDSVYNSDMNVIAGKGISGLFGGTFSPRKFNGTFYYSKTSCGSSFASVKATILPLLSGAGLSKGTPFQGSFASVNTSINPDHVAPADTNTYNLIVPTGLNNSDYGSTWTVKSWSFKTAKGTASANISFTAPSGSTSGFFRFIPKTADLDSTYLLTITETNGANGCDTTFTRYIHVTSKPVAGFTVSSTVCLGTPLTFTNTSTTAGKLVPITYKWYFGTGDVSSVVNPKYNYNKVGTGTYTVSLVATTQGYKDSTAKTVTVYASPSGMKYSQGKPFTGSFYAGISSTSNPDVLCQKDTNRYELAPPTGFLNTDYPAKWNILSVTVKTVKGTVIKDTATTKPSAKGNFSVAIFPKSTYTDSIFVIATTVRVNGGPCDTIINRYVRISPRPTASFTPSASAICQGKPLKFTNNSADNSVLYPMPITKYTWYFGTGAPYVTTTKTSPTYNYNKVSPGNYTVSLVVTNGICKDSTAQVITIFQGLNGNTLIQGKPFQGSFSNGTIGDPDRVCSGDTLRYEMTPPTFLGNSDYGTKWTISAISFKTINGGLSTDTATSKPTATKNFAFTYFPIARKTNDTFVVTFTVKSLATGGCDTVFSRYILSGARPIPYFKANDVCIGSTTDFIDSTITAGPADFVYDFGDGGTSTFRNPSHTYAAAGAYNVKLAVTSLSGCTDYYSRKVTVFAPPVLRFGGLAACAGSPTSFVDSTSSTSGQTVTSWKWDFGDPNSGSLNTSILASPYHTYKTAGNYTVKLTVVTKNGCTATAYRTVTVSGRPTAAYTFINNCTGYELVFTNGSTAPSGSIYKWEFGDGQTATTKDVTHKYFNSQEYRVKLTVTSPAGCIDTIVKKITPYPGPKVSIGMSNACVGTSVQFTDLSTIPNAPAGVIIQYRKWDFGDGTISNTQFNTIAHTYTVAGTYYVTLAATTSQGCIDSTTTSITIYDKPMPDFSYVAGCPDNPVTFTDKSTNGTGSSLTYRWDFGDGNTSSLKNPTHTYAGAGKYDVTITVTNAEGCSDKTVKTVTVNPSPKPDFNFNFVVGSSTQKKYKFDVTSPGNYTSIEWHFNDASTDSMMTGSSVQHTFKTGKKYLIRLVTVNTAGCTAERDTFLNLTTGIEQIKGGESGISVFPNPFSSETNIRYTLNGSSTVSIRVTDAAGREVANLSDGEKQLPGEHDVAFSASKYGLPSGVYFIKMTVDDAAYTIKVVVAK